MYMLHENRPPGTEDELTQPLRHSRKGYTDNERLQQISPEIRKDSE